MKKAVVFDIYGTMIDIRTDEHDSAVYDTLARYLAYIQVFVHPEELKQAYFQRVEEILRESTETYPEVDVFQVFDGLLRCYGRKKLPRKTVLQVAMLYRSLTIRSFALFPGVLDVLPWLKKACRIAIVSDAQWVFTEPELAMLGLDIFFKTVLLSSRFGFKKPDPRLFSLALDRLGVLPEESVYIGDNPHKDLVGAKMAGMSFLFYRTECKEVNGFQADGVFHDYWEIPELLRSMN
ncbi:MAG: HAD family hydrolase [Syntrophobacteraceae bacterium]|nr:HAD family hydrolase [Syntrophobacteraceae bacterium]